MKVQKEKTTPISLKLPTSLVEEIDQICSVEFISRTSFIIKASKFFLEYERTVRTEELIKNIAKKEKQLKKFETTDTN